MKLQKYRAWVFVCIATLAFGPVALAQQQLASTSTIASSGDAKPILLAQAGAAASDQGPTTKPASASNAPVDALSEIVVTGSRIERPNYDTPTPVTVASVAELQQTTPSNIADALNKLPQFAGSLNAQTINNPSFVSVGNYLNIRDLGAGRTLVLLDGNRVPANSNSGTVDVNTFPELLVNRVEVVTGGASAVYGSDAVSGVVNYILDKQFDGVKGVLDAGRSAFADDSSWRGGVAAGMHVTDALHIEFAFDHYDSDGIPVKEDRPNGSPPWNVVGTGTAANPYVLVHNGLLGNSTYGGLVTTGPFAGQMFLPNGSLTPFVPGLPTQTPQVQIGGDGSYYNNLTLISSLLTNKAFGRIDYEILPNISAYVQYNYAESTNVYNGVLDPMHLTIYADNAFLNPAAAAALAAAGDPSFQMSRNNSDLFNIQQASQKSTSSTVTAGLTGSFLDTWKWNTHFTYGTGVFTSITSDNINQPRFFAALDSVINPATGTPACRVSLGPNAALYPGCVPLNLFGSGAFSQAALNYIAGDTRWDNRNELTDIDANLNGQLYHTWAGPISVAFDAEYRKQELNQTSNANPLVPASFTGLTPNVGYSATSGEWFGPTTAPQSASNNVKEVAVETVIPLAKDLTMLKSLEVNGAYRYTDYSSSGGTNTWKIGAIWQPVNDLRIRVTNSQDILAPNLLQLYSGPAASLASFNDPHTGGAGVIPIISQGNPNLVPEVAKTITGGFVFTPSFIPRFEMTFDIFSIHINNAITAVSGGNPTVAAQCEASGGTSPFCSLYVRPHPFSDTSPDNFPTELLSENLNVAQVYTKGFDAEVHYSFPVASLVPSIPGDITLRLLDEYQPVLRTKTIPGAIPTDVAGVVPTAAGGGFPTNKATLFAGYNVGNFSSLVQVNYLAATVRNNNSLQVWAQNNIPAYTYTDLNLSYKLTAIGGVQLETFFTIENLFNQQPPIALPSFETNIPGYAYPAPFGYDVIGRYYTWGVRFKM